MNKKYFGTIECGRRIILPSEVISTLGFWDGDRVELSIKGEGNNKQLSVKKLYPYEKEDFRMIVELVTIAFKGVEFGLFNNNWRFLAGSDYFQIGERVNLALWDIYEMENTRGYNLVNLVVEKGLSEEKVSTIKKMIRKFLTHE